MLHTRRLFVCLFLGITLSPAWALGQIYQWEYVDPLDPAQGKQQSTTLVPDGTTANFNTIIGLLGRNLTKAYLPAVQIPNFRISSTRLNDAYLPDASLISVSGSEVQARHADFSGANLLQASIENSDLTGANFTGANLTQARFSGTNLTDVDFADAIITHGRFSRTTSKGFTAAQLYQTASYKNGGLGSIDLSNNDLSGWDFTGQAMPRSNFFGAKFDNAVFVDADITAADFSASDLTAAQLYQTASYQNGMLDEMQFELMDLHGWNFSGQSLVGARLTRSQLSNAVFDGANLTNVNIGGEQFVQHDDVSFRGANLTNSRFDNNNRWERADFTGANLEGANLTSNRFANSVFDDAIIRGSEMGLSDDGITLENFYSTASYKTGDLTNIEMHPSNFSGVNLRGKDISGTSFRENNLSQADFREAKAVGTHFGTILNGADFRGADLTNANFFYNPVSFIDFRGANLSGAGFERTSLKNADFTDAIVYGARLSVENSPQDLTAQQLYSTASYKAGSLGPITLAGNMQGWDFRNQDLSGARFDRSAQLVGALWSGATLRQVTFFVNALQDADFRHNDIRGAQFLASELDRSDFRAADLAGARFSESSLVDARFEGAQITDASFNRVDLRGADFADTNLRGTSFSSVDDFTGADFTDADIVGGGFPYATGDGFTLAQLRSTKSFKERNLSGVSFEGNNFAGIDLSNFNMAGGDLNRSNLTGANLSGTDLTDVSFQYAHLTDLNLNGAIIRRGNFSSTVRDGFTRAMLESTASFQAFDLRGINLSSNDLQGWDFRYQDLREADFTGSNLQGTLFDLADLRAARPMTLTGAIVQRAILPNATLTLMWIKPGETMSLRQAPDYPPIISPPPRGGQSDPAPVNPKGIVVGNAIVENGGALKILLDENDWKSTLIFGPSANAVIGGTLELLFDDTANPTNAVGESFDLFDWPTNGPSGAFQIVTDPRLTWDLSSLYTTGSVRLVAVVPEPVSLVLSAFALSGCALRAGRCRRAPRNNRPRFGARARRG